MKDEYIPKKLVIDELNIDTLEVLEEIDVDQSLFVLRKDQIYYGYSQMWYDEKLKQAGGCGPALGLDIIKHLASLNKTWESHYLTIYDKKDIHFVMTEGYKNFKPFELETKWFFRQLRKVKSWGIPETLGVYSVNKLKKLMQSYCNKYDLPLIQETYLIKPWKYKKQNSSKLKDEIVNFIIHHLSHNRPVGFLNTFVDHQLYYKNYSDTHKKRMSELRKQSFIYHWVLITGIYKYEQEYILKCSTWGGIGYFTLSEFLVYSHKALRFFPSGMIANYSL